MAKQSNEYVDVIGGELFELMPKTVIAAIAVSLAIRLDGRTNARELIKKEWWTLFHNGIIPQKPKAPEYGDTK